MRPVSHIERTVAPFEVVSPYQPSGDQPTAIADLARRIEAGEKDVVLLGATGTGKSATTAWMIEKLQRPTLVMAPNKTLAAQLANEFRELLPNNAVEYFVSYYDYYQPEAYVPQSDTYIEKDSSINEEVERLRHSATNSLLTRRDVVVVASVSCIYGLGTPQEYVDRMVPLRVGDEIDRDELLRRFVDIQYTRNDLAFTRGTFRVRGDTIEIFPVYEELAVRIEMFGDEIEALSTLHPVTGEIISDDDHLYVFPASHYVAGPERMERAVNDIEKELVDRLAELEKQGKLLEAQRLRMRTTYDIEMLRQIGTCSGVENYSMHFDGRLPGSPPNTLLDYFPDDFLLVIDESHVTVPQIGAMYEGDASRKRTLVDHGFRLPSALDNRPLKWEEFQERIGQTVYLSATPGQYELSRSDGVVEQIIRPPGLVDPEVVVKPTEGQIDDLVHEIRKRTENDERVLVPRSPRRWPRTSPTTSWTGHPGPLPAQRRRHPAPRRAAARAAHRRLRRPVGTAAPALGPDHGDTAARAPRGPYPPRRPTAPNPRHTGAVPDRTPAAPAPVPGRTGPGGRHARPAARARPRRPGRLQPPPPPDHGPAAPTTAPAQPGPPGPSPVTRPAGPWRSGSTTRCWACSRTWPAPWPRTAARSTSPTRAWRRNSTRSCPTRAAGSADTATPPARPPGSGTTRSSPRPTGARPGPHPARRRVRRGGTRPAAGVRALGPSRLARLPGADGDSHGGPPGRPPPARGRRGAHPDAVPAAAGARPVDRQRTRPLARRLLR
ncbi:UvrABC system protein B [Streptomyces fumanus]